MLMAIGTFMGCSSIVADITNSKKSPDSIQDFFEAMYNSFFQAVGGDRDG
jgi:hypothetical protein